MEGVRVWLTLTTCLNFINLGTTLCFASIASHKTKKERCSVNEIKKLHTSTKVSGLGKKHLNVLKIIRHQSVIKLPQHTMSFRNVKMLKK